MKKNKMTPVAIIKRLESIEKDVRELRETIIQSTSNATLPVSNTQDTYLQYTLDDVYDAFGKRKHYAVRLKEALAQKGITTLSEFLSLSTGELLELDGIGYETLLRTKKALDLLGVPW